MCKISVYATISPLHFEFPCVCRWSWSCPSPLSRVHDLWSSSPWPLRLCLWTLRSHHHDLEQIFQNILRKRLNVDRAFVLGIILTQQQRYFYLKCTAHQPIILPNAVWGTSITSVMTSQSVASFSSAHCATRICSGEPWIKKFTMLCSSVFGSTFIWAPDFWFTYTNVRVRESHKTNHIHFN